MLANLGAYSGTAGLTLIALAVITRRLVWYTDLRDAKREAMYWRKFALKTLGVSEVIVTAGEAAQAEVDNGGGQ